MELCNNYLLSNTLNLYYYTSVANYRKKIFSSHYFSKFQLPIHNFEPFFGISEMQ